MGTAYVAAGERVATADQRVILHRVPWSHFEAQLALRGEVAGPRMAYLTGNLELMSPSKDHERIRSFIGRMIEAYALECDIDMSPYGSWTLKNAPREAGVEPDECYLVGDQSRDRPDLAIEVEWTSGGLDKLEIYRRLGVGEVWAWRRGQIQIHVLRGDDYVRSPRSRLFRGLDVKLLESLLDKPTALQAVRAFRGVLRQRASRPRRKR